MNGDQIFQNVVTQVFTPLYQFMVGMAFLYFFYGGFMFIVNVNNPEKREIGKQHLLYGTIGLFIILSVGGILQLLNSTLGGMFIF